MLAQWCHARSHRANGPFVSVGIAAIPAESQVAELAGRMTADGRQEVGRLAQTRGGTLFLDDVEQLCDEAQGFLLGALERQAFRPLDGAMDQRFDGTVIAATSADLRALVAEGSFREDLLYRLEALPVRLPGLDQRRDELPAWSAWFLSERHMERDGSGETRFTEDAIALLESRSWPGSLRQLRNVVRRAYALALVDQRASDSLLICRKEHVAGALQHELSTQDGPLERLQMLADQLVGDLQNREEAADVLDLVGPVVRALMLHTANEKVGTLRDAYTALGKDQVVRSRNHQKLYRKDLEQLNEWCRLVGIEPPSFADQTLKR
jgi:DNA-binding NtrC family response regulator